MKNLLRKELRLAAHPTNFIFLSLSAMLLIPNYPYYSTFFYTTLGIFFLCLAGRENHDIEYSLVLPIRKAEIVTARFGIVILLEVLQLVLAVPFALLRGTYASMANEAGMEANIAFFGLSLLMLGLFNFSFFTRYYRNPAKVGSAFVLASTYVFVYILVAEALTHVLPFFRDQLDTADPAFLGSKLLVLGIGLAGFAALNLAGLRLSQKRFSVLDL